MMLFSEGDTVGHLIFVSLNFREFRKNKGCIYFNEFMQVEIHTNLCKKLAI